LAGRPAGPTPQDARTLGNEHARINRGSFSSVRASCGAACGGWPTAAVWPLRASPFLRYSVVIVTAGCGV